MIPEEACGNVQIHTALMKDVLRCVVFCSHDEPTSAPGIDSPRPATPAPTRAQWEHRKDAPPHPLPFFAIPQVFYVCCHESCLIGESLRPLR
jgi:hypothetical protein